VNEIWLVIIRKIIKGCFHYMTDFTDKMHQIRFQLGLRQFAPYPAVEFKVLAGFKGLL